MNENRKFIVASVFLFVGVIYLIKLFGIQVLNGTYKSAAESNIIKKVEEYPYRGLVYDRNGKLLVYNKPVYDLMVIPKEAKNLDTLAFCNLLGITKKEFLDYVQKMKKDKAYVSYRPNPFIKQLSAEDFAKIQDNLIEYPGFYIQARTVRSYPYPVLANALGYIREIDPGRLAQDTTNYYKQGDYVGVAGVEAKYEPILRGKRGIRLKIKNVSGVVKGDYMDGKYDTLSVAGKNLVSSINLELQQYGEMLMQGKLGSIVCIEPSTGEILTIVSAPTYDPNILTGRELGKNFSKLQSDSLVPMFNRPIMAQYPPGSMFKLIQSLIGLQEGVITPQTRFHCNRGIINCHGPHSNEDLRGAITVSCNPYFYNTFREIINQQKSKNTFVDSKLGLQVWNEYLHRFGLGTKLNIDIPGAKTGNVPTPNYYDKIYGENHWKFSTIYSLSIGQGELGVTPMQMANLAAIIANRGHFYTPHIIKDIAGGGPLPEYTVKHETGVDPRHFEVVIDGMENVIQRGTGQYRAKISDITVCGKTSTVQNPHGEDHSGFLAFAPKENPKIAVAVYVENAGQGARAAASIASLMIEKYINGEIKRKNIEEYVKKGIFY